MELKELHAEQQKAFGALNDALKAYDAEVKAHGTALGETKAKVDTINDRLDQLEGLIQRKTREIAPESKDKPYDTPEMRAQEAYLRYGEKKNFVTKISDEDRAAFQTLQTKALSSGLDAQGGIFSPEDFRLQIIQKIPNFSNVGALMNRVTTSRDVLRWPSIPYSADDINSSGVAVTWEDENDEATETDFAMGSVAVPVRKARALIKVPVELLEDTAIDIIGLITGLLAQSFAIEEDSVFTNGAGGKKPEGYMTNGSIAVIVNGHATQLQYDGLMDFVYGLPEQYAANAVIACKRTFIRDLRKVKDSDGRPLWQPSLTVGEPSTFSGVPIKTNEHMPAIASDAKPAIHADFKQLYTIAERTGMTIKRLDELFARTDEVGFIARRRVGGRVTAAWAGKKLHMHT